MARKSACLLLVALGIALPGCLQFPGRSGVVSERPKEKSSDTSVPKRDPSPEADLVPSTALTNQTQQTTDKADASQAIEPGPLPSLFETAGSKKPAAGSTGVVTIEQALQPKEPKKDGDPPTPPRKISPLAQAMDDLLNERHAEAIIALRAYDEPTQEFFIRVGPILALIAKKSIDNVPPQEMVVLVEQLRAIQDLLRTRCELLVTRMCYAKRIDGYGSYVPLPDDHAFLARTEDRPGELVQLYVELKNFASVKTKEGDYLTRLTCSLEVNDMNNKKVWSHIFDKNETTHRPRSCINDYHGNYSFYVPALPAGTYRLTIQIVDETIPAHIRVARKSLDFRVTPVANPLSSR